MPAVLTKRHHALHELLSSERAYASDLTLIRDFHIPLALGQPPSLALRTLSTASDSSSSSGSDAPSPPPMTQEDVKVIFNNITELAAFSDMFSDELEDALGANIDGGTGDDRVGELFLRIIPQLEKPFKQYITRHPTALSHLQALPSTPELQHYLSYTQSVAKAHSHAWDLASLLIKPVQRLLKYPLLLNAIIEETPDTHPDKDNLRSARSKMEEVARNVNEGRRRAEVIRDVLSGGKGVKKTTKEVGVTIAAGVGLSKVKSLRHGGVAVATMKADLAAAAAAADDPSGAGSAQGGGDGTLGSEAVQVGLMHDELKRIDAFAQQFAKNAVDYSKSMFNLMLALRQWAISFGRVIGLTPDQGSEAFDAFIEVIQQHLMPLAVDLEGVINEKILKELAYLLGTMTQPFKLLASMNEQEPFHYHLLTMPISAKNKPPPSLLAASQNYLALRGQLAAELPDYIRLFHHGLAAIVLRLGEIQRRFWRDVRDKWGALWEMLRVEGEMNAGSEETVGVWGLRFRDVEALVQCLRVIQPPPVFSPSSSSSSPPAPSILSGSASGKSRRGSVDYFPSPAPSFQAFGPTPNTNGNRLEKRHSQKKNSTGGASNSSASLSSPPANAATVQAMFAALEPAHSPRIQQQQQQFQQYSKSNANGTSPTKAPPPAPINVFHAQAYGLDDIPISSGLGSSALPSAATGNSFGSTAAGSAGGPGPSLAGGVLYGGGVGLAGGGMAGMLPSGGGGGGGDRPTRALHHRRGSSQDSAAMHAMMMMHHASHPALNAAAGNSTSNPNPNSASPLSSGNGINTTGTPRRRESIGSRQAQNAGRRRTVTAGMVDEGEFYTVPATAQRDRESRDKEEFSMLTPAQQYAYVQAHGYAPPGYSIQKQQQQHHHAYSQPSNPHHTASSPHAPAHPHPHSSYSPSHTSHGPSQSPVSPSNGKPAIPRTKSMPLANQLNGGTARYIPPHAVMVNPRDLDRLPMPEGGEYIVDPSGHVYFVPAQDGGYGGGWEEERGREREREKERMRKEAEREKEREKEKERMRKEAERGRAERNSKSSSMLGSPARNSGTGGGTPVMKSSPKITASSPQKEQRDRDRDSGSPKAKSKERHADSGPGKEKGESRSKDDKEKEKGSEVASNKERPGHARKRSGSVKSITSFFTSSSSKDAFASSGSSSSPPNTFFDSDSPPLPSLHSTPPPANHRDSWVSKPAKYICQVIHPCQPPAAVSYYSFPFFTLLEGELFEVLQEAGHPSIHPKLPLYVDDGEDCLLLCRDGRGTVGWALASFLEPVGLDFNVGTGLGRR